VGLMQVIGGPTDPLENIDAEMHLKASRVAEIGDTPLERWLERQILLVAAYGGDRAADVLRQASASRLPARAWS
jgi:hypothetical protein